MLVATSRREAPQGEDDSYASFYSRGNSPRCQSFPAGCSPPLMKRQTCRSCCRSPPSENINIFRRGTVSLVHCKNDSTPKQFGAQEGFNLTPYTESILNLINFVPPKRPTLTRLPLQKQNDYTLCPKTASLNPVTAEKMYCLYFEVSFCPK